MEKSTLTGINDIDNYVLSEYFSYKDLHCLCLTSKWLYDTMSSHIYNIRKIHFIPLNGLIVPYHLNIGRVYQLQENKKNEDYNIVVYDIDYIDIRYGITFEWYVKFKLRHVNTNHTIYSCYNVNGKLSKLFKIAYDDDAILSLYILHVS